MRRTVMVGEEQQAHADLRDEQRLGEREKVGHEPARLASAVVREPGESCSAPGRGEHEECDNAVCR